MNLVGWLVLDLYDFERAISEPFYTEDFMENYDWTCYEASVRTESGDYGKFQC